MEYTSKKLNDDVNETKYEVTVDFKELLPFQEEALLELAKDVKIQGFRPGKAPKHMLESKVGSEALNRALGSLLPTVAYEIIEKENKKPIEAPRYDLTKLDPKEGIIFTITFVNYPEVKLGDWSKIKAKKEEVKIDDEEITTVVKSIVRSSVKPERIKELTKVTEVKNKKVEEHKAKKAKEKKESKSKDEQDHKDHDHPNEAPQNFDFELNDELVKELGYEKEKTLKDVKAAVKERLVSLKEQQNQEKFISDVIEEAIKLSKFEIPDRFIENEVKAQETEFNSRLAELSLDADTYLKTQGSSIEKKREEWKEQAKQRVSSDIVLVNVAMQADNLPLDEDIEAEINKIEDPKIRSSYEKENGRQYIRGILTRQRGLDIILKAIDGK